MNRPARSIEIFTMSALDLFVTAMGSFAILMMILFPYFREKKSPKIDKEAIAKSRLLFCIWDTRVKDFEQFYNETAGDKSADPAGGKKQDAWKNPGFDQQPDFPVVSVSWTQAREFCKWLTEKERKADRIGPEDEYRLPTDAEWTAARGPGQCLWGDQWPPPPDAGKYANYAGKEYDEGAGTKGQLGTLGFRDPFEMVAPVGSFKPNRYGLYDMGGNVWQWCEDYYQSSMNPKWIRDIVKRLNEDGGGNQFRVLRGAGWQSRSGVETVGDYRENANPNSGWEDTGFRCVLVLKSPSKP